MSSAELLWKLLRTLEYSVLGGATVFLITLPIFRISSSKYAEKWSNSSVRWYHPFAISFGFALGGTVFMIASEGIRNPEVLMYAFAGTMLCGLVSSVTGMLVLWHADLGLFGSVVGAAASISAAGYWRHAVERFFGVAG